MLKPIATAFSVVSGVIFAALGLVLALWVGLAVYEVERAIDWVLWAAERSPVPLSVPSLELAKQAVQQTSLIVASAGAALLLGIGYSNLRGPTRPVEPDQSHDAKWRLALKTEHPPVGGPLEGMLILLKGGMPGDVFWVELACTQSRHLQGERKPRIETAFWSQQNVPANQGVQGLNVPLRFDIPMTAPAEQPYQWRLAVFPAKGWFAIPSRFTINLAPAPAEALRAIEASQRAAQKEAIETVGRQLHPFGKPLLPHERAQLRGLSPEDLARAVKISAMPAKILMWVVIPFVVVPTVLMAIVLAAGLLLAR